MTERVKRVELRVSDPARSGEFYSRLTGLEPDTAAGDEVRLGAASELVLRRAESGGSTSPRAPGLFHTAFLWPTRAGLAGALRRAAEISAQRITGYSDHGVSEAIYLDDPDGLGIELYADRPREAWPEPSEGERVRMFTEPLDIGNLLAAEDADAAGQVPAIGHVHLKVSDLDASTSFWTDEGAMELMAGFGADANFLAYDGYHHHIGINSWLSRGADPDPPGRPGIELIAFETAGAREPGTETTPDGIMVGFEAAG